MFRSLILIDSLIVSWLFLSFCVFIESVSGLLKGCFLVNLLIVSSVPGRFWSLSRVFPECLFSFDRRLRSIKIVYPNLPLIFYTPSHIHWCKITLRAPSPDLENTVFCTLPQILSFCCAIFGTRWKIIWLDCAWCSLLSFVTGKDWRPTKYLKHSYVFLQVI